MTQRRDGVEAVPRINHDDDTMDTRRSDGASDFVIVATSWFCL